VLKKWWWLAPVLAVMMIAVYWYWPRGYCRSAKRKYGLTLEQCPDGKLRQRVSISGSALKRGGPGTVYVSATAIYTIAQADTWMEVAVGSFEVDLALVDSAGKETPLEPKKKWKREWDQRSAEIVLPEVRDGDYRLRADVKSKIGKTSVDLPLALYAPSRVHVLTDRPLYEPGNTVRFRALVLRARDLTPIDHRPGTWIVRDPTGEVLLEEKAPAGEWGVVAGNFPLDREAEVGDWTVAWRSGGAEESMGFRVEPFTLPRFRVEADADRPFYRAGDKPRVYGAVIYSSGAPVANAQLEIDWTVSSSRWPAPTEWSRGALPVRAVTKNNGRFELELPEIPADLQEQATLFARISAVDPAGDRVEGAITLLLSEDAIQAEAITELSGGMVESFNNRVYVRVTTADGRPVSGAAVNIKRAWSGTDKGIDAVLDADSVARIQIDPGPPVNVVIPAAPYRPQPRAKVVSRTAARDHLGRKSASLADQLEMDRWLAPLEACAKWVGDGTASATVVLRVNEGGAIVVAAATGTSFLDRCVLATVRKRKLARGKARLLTVSHNLREPDLPSLQPDFANAMSAPADVLQVVGRGAAEARDCIPGAFEGQVPLALSWQLRAGQKQIGLTWLPTSSGRAMPPRLAACLRANFTRGTLDKAASRDMLGLVRFSVDPPDAVKQHRPQPTIMRGYELLVTARVGEEEIGSTKLRMQPGEVPALRLRATPVVAKPGEEVTVKLIRGPSFSGDLPEHVYVEHFGKSEETKVDDKTRTARFEIPADGKGWYSVTARGERALVFVRSLEDLSVSVKPDRESYAPGQQAKIGIRTEIGGKPASAAVGLFGVDESLSQLTSLVGPDDLPFGVLDGQALVLGRVRGQNAAEATILRVSQVPSPPDLDVELFESAQTEFDPVAELTDRFYIILAELHSQTRAWEKQAPEKEVMKPETMAKLWEKALDACKGRGERIDDAFGRRLRLHRLPSDLLELTDPRQVVVVGTRLPEDVENWQDWVMRRKP